MGLTPYIGSTINVLGLGPWSWQTCFKCLQDMFLLRRVRRSLDTESSLIDKLQYVQNVAARLRGLSRVMHDDLHWLVIPQRVQYKLAVTVHRCLQHWAPRYLADYCVPVSEVSGRQHLRSARCHQLSVPRVRLSTLGSRAFFCCRTDNLEFIAICGIQLLTLGWTWWRICLLDIRSVSALEVFR